MSNNNNSDIAKIISNSLDSMYKFNAMNEKFGNYTWNSWEEIHKFIKKNRDFKNDNKSNYLEEALFDKAETNIKTIPRVVYPLTSYIITRQARIYNRSTFLETNNNAKLEKWVDLTELKNSLIKINIDYFLHKAAFLEVDTKSSDKLIKFKKINPDNIVYDISFTKIMIRRENILDKIHNFEYIIDREKEVARLKTILKFSKTDYHKNLLAFFTKKKGKWVIFNIYAETFKNAYDKFIYYIMNIEGNIHMKFTDIEQYVFYKGKEEVNNIIPIFSNEYKTALPNSIVENDLALSLLYSFGLAGVPSELITKFMVTRSIGSGAGSNKATLMKEIANFLAVVNLEEGEDLKQLKTGEVNSMINLVNFFNTVYNQLCIFHGIPAPFPQQGTSGGVQVIAEKVADTFTDSDKTNFDEFELKLFNVLQKIIKGINFQLIKKYSGIQTSSEILNEEILKGSNGLTTPIDSIMRIYKVSNAIAEERFEEIIEHNKKYPNMYSGVAGQSTNPNASMGQTMYSNKEEEKGNQGDITEMKKEDK